MLVNFSRYEAVEQGNPSGESLNTRVCGRGGWRESGCVGGATFPPMRNYTIRIVDVGKIPSRKFEPQVK